MKGIGGYSVSSGAIEWSHKTNLINSIDRMQVQIKPCTCSQVQDAESIKGNRFRHRHGKQADDDEEEERIWVLERFYILGWLSVISITGSI